MFQRDLFATFLTVEFKRVLNIRVSAMSPAPHAASVFLGFISEGANGSHSSVTSWLAVAVLVHSKFILHRL